jgi:hypothetical protein
MDLSWVGVLPSQTHPFGTEYHTACCGLSGILFSMELVEEKDHPPQIQERWSEVVLLKQGMLIFMN